MKTQKYHHGNLEAALLEAGVRVARISGSKNLGVNALAKEVSVSPMAVYRHFSNGEGLKASSSQQAREELARRMIEAISHETSVKARFEATGRTYIQFALNEPGLFSVAFVACEAPPKREDSPSAWMVFQDSILDLCNEGLIQAAEVRQVTDFAWAAVHGYANLAGGSDPMRPKAEPEIIDGLLERIWFGIVKESVEIKK
jgi:AcrR family transcriptional regulator